MPIKIATKPQFLLHSVQINPILISRCFQVARSDVHDLHNNYHNSRGNFDHYSLKRWMEKKYWKDSLCNKLPRTFFSLVVCLNLSDHAEEQQKKNER